MRTPVGECILELLVGDLVAMQVDAIVNAANAQLVVGGGVDGAIHRAAGLAVHQETSAKYPNGCETGSAVASGAGELSAQFLFHAVGPVWQGGQQGEADLLRSAYQKCLQLAVQNDCRSIAFPAISTGIYGYPVDRAAETSLNAVVDFLEKHQKPALVKFVLFSAGHYGAFSRVLEEIITQRL